MLANEAAAYLAGVISEDDSQAHAPTNVHLISGTVVGDSENGKVKILINGITFSENDSQYIELDSVGGLKDGDTATILLTGEPGHAMSPLALGGVGVIDRVVEQVDEVEADNVTINNTLTAQNGRIGTLEVSNVTINNTLTVQNSRIGTLEANDVTINNTLTAQNGRIGTLESDNVTINNTLTAQNGRIGTLEANDVTINNTLTAQNGRIGTLEADNVTINNTLTAQNGRIGTLEANDVTINNALINKADIDAANINNATIRNAWVDQLMVQTDLLSHEGTIYTLDAIQVNASNITAGTISVERLIITVNGEKYLVSVDPSTGTTTNQKLDGNVIKDLTITADKIVAEAITAEKITTQNIVGTGGWINLRNGTFQYVNAITQDGISWDGSHLYIGSAGGTVSAEDIAIAANTITYDCTYVDTTVQIDSATFEAYVFTASVFKGGVDITDDVPEEYFLWYVKNEEFGTIPVNPDTGTNGQQFTFIKEDAGYRAYVIGGLDDAYFSYDPEAVE